MEFFTRKDDKFRLVAITNEIGLKKINKYNNVFF